jgi:hypothetical protein
MASPLSAFTALTALSVGVHWPCPGHRASVRQLHLEMRRDGRYGRGHSITVMICRFCGSAVYKEPLSRPLRDQKVDSQDKALDGNIFRPADPQSIADFDSQSPSTSSPYSSCTSSALFLGWPSPQSSWRLQLLRLLSGLQGRVSPTVVRNTVIAANTRMSGGKPQSIKRQQVHNQDQGRTE